jgi:predicted nucleic acid-binding protein
VSAQRAPCNHPGNHLLRAGKSFSVARLQTFAAATPGRYLPLSDEALQLAADLWAQARQQGRPTADVKDLNIDVLLAAQALTFGPVPADVVIATTNAKHLSQFAPANVWQEIIP